MSRRAVFFDRDGVILKTIVENGIPRPPYSIAEYREKSGVIAGAREAVAAVKAAGFLAILVTNQPDVKYGKITKEDFEYIQGEVAALSFDDIFLCPHGREDGCDCKKPKPGMLLTAAKKWEIDLAQSFMVGDSAADVGAGKAAGCKTILLDYGYNQGIVAYNRVTGIGTAVDAILVV